MAYILHKRRLAAILFADVAGYSRLMEQDETGTHVRVGAVFVEVLEPSIVRHAGRLIHKTGDGILAEFPSATAALRCAIEVQRQSDERNQPVRHRDQIRFRIGINVADILVDEQDIAGGGVNLAARLETLAPPGGICISQALKEQIQEDLGVEFLDCGTQRVKNISRPVRVFEVLPASGSTIARWRARVRQAVTVSRWIWVTALGASLAASVLLVWRPTQRDGQEGLDKLSVTVLPFRAEAQDPASNEVASRLQRRLLMALSPESNLLKVKGLAAESTPDQRWDLNRVRTDLKARYALVGEVSQAGESRRVEARLLDTVTGAVAWSDSFDIPQHLERASLEISAQRLAPAVRDEVAALEVGRVIKSPPPTPDAMDLVLLGFGQLGSKAPGGLDRADNRFKQALALDPKNVPAMLGRVEVIGARLRALSGDQDRSALLRELDELTLAAVTADPECGSSWTARSQVLELMGQHDAAFAALEKALRINPNNVSAQWQRSALLIASGRSEEVIQPLDQVKLIYEKTALIQFIEPQCMARIYANHPNEAAEACEAWYAMGGSTAALRALAAVYAMRGDSAKAAKAAAQLSQLEPTESIGTIRDARHTLENTHPILAAQAEDTLYRGLKLAKLPE